MKKEDLSWALKRWSDGQICIGRGKGWISIRAQGTEGTEVAVEKLLSEEEC